MHIATVLVLFWGEQEKGCGHVYPVPLLNWLE